MNEYADFYFETSFDTKREEILSPAEQRTNELQKYREMAEPYVRHRGYSASCPYVRSLHSLIESFYDKGIRHPELLVGLSILMAHEASDKFGPIINPVFRAKKANKDIQRFFAERATRVLEEMLRTQTLKAPFRFTPKIHILKRLFKWKVEVTADTLKGFLFEMYWFAEDPHEVIGIHNRFFRGDIK